MSLGENLRAAPKEEIRIGEYMFQVAPDIFRIGERHEPHIRLGAPNSYAIKGTRGIVVVDTGYGDIEYVDAINELMESSSPLGFIATHGHWDHAGEMEEMAREMGVPVLRGGRDFTTPQTISLGERDLIVIPAPGHTEDSVYVVDSNRRAVFMGDNGLPNISSNIDEEFMGEYMRGLENLLQYQPEIFCGGHGPVRYDATRRIQELINYRVARELKILLTVDKGLGKIADIAEEVYRDEDKDSSDRRRTNQVLSHLIKLQQEGILSTNGSEWFRVNGIE